MSPRAASGWRAELKLRYERVGERTVLACIGNGHSCTHDNNCCSGNCVNRTCK